MIDMVNGGVSFYSLLPFFWAAIFGGSAVVAS